MKKKLIISLISVITISAILIIYAINKNEEGAQALETNTDTVVTESETNTEDQEEEKAEEKLEETTATSTIEESNTQDSSAGNNNSQSTSNIETKEESSSTTTNVTESPKPAVVEETKKSIYKDGAYSGSGEGLNGKMAVNVTISGDKITAIALGSNEEDAEYLDVAKEVINKIISSQSTSVDTISGATFSSNGIINGVSDALSKAKN